MLNRLVNILAVAAFGALVLTFGFVEWRISQQHPSEQTHPAKHESHEDILGKVGESTAYPETNGERKYKPHWYDTLVDHSPEWFLAFITAGLLLLTFHQLRTTRAQLRAYVFINAARIAKHPDLPGPWEIHIEVKNFGETPAYDVVARLERKITNPIPQRHVLRLSEKAETSAKSAIAPGHFQTIRMIFTELPYGDWGVARQAKQAAYIWGRVEYRDAFRQRRFITLQMVHDFDIVHEFGFCEVGNNEGIVRRFGRWRPYPQ